jgi:predicted GNAT family acetyltransferase
MQAPIINNEKHRRFETEINGKLAYVEYSFYKDDIVLMHTFVPESARGKGIAATLAKFVLEYAEKKKIKIIVQCSFIATYIKLHPEYESLIDKQ